MAHIPVLIKEVLDGLHPMPNQNFIDATVGDGGHATAILEKTAPTGKLIAIDRDSGSISRAKLNLENFGDRVIFINDSFAHILNIYRESNIEKINGILFDFGMSSSQIQDSGRGFSFNKDEILDMRFDVNSHITAEYIINTYNEEELAEIFKKWGEEEKSRQIAKAIVYARNSKHIKTTIELVKIIESVKRRTGKINPSTLVFQALRIEVNQEMREIEKALGSITQIIYKGGCVAFISFHSLEDRLIKNWSRNLEKTGAVKIINKKPITASVEELVSNPRSRSAKLRIVQKQ